MTARRLILRDREAAAWQAGMLSAVVRPFRSRYDWYVEDGQPFYREYVHAEPDPVSVPCPLGDRGQRLWVAESWAMYQDADGKHPVYLADRQDHDGMPPPGYRHWRSPATMPQWASRSTAVHLGSRLVRVQSVTDDEAKACGISADCPIGHIPAYQQGPFAYCFAQQFVAAHGQAAWDANAWCWLHWIGRE